MILTSLDGGLGNQMFQYAAGLRLACARETKLKLDLSPLEEAGCKTPRTYALGVFQIRAEVADAADRRAFSTERSFLGRLAQRFGGAAGRDRSSDAAIERHFHFDDEVASLPDGSWLRGYWQSQRYFDDADADVRRDFAFAQPPAGHNAALLREIQGKNSVSVHVRRGDYVEDPTTNATHGVCDLDYYRRAIALLTEKTSEPEFFLFSDDPEWTRANLGFAQPATVVDHNGPDAGHEDLRLMSQCSHHIIANSSFSWWGAWLGTGSDRIVVAPKQWFRDDTRDTRDLIPEGWARR